MDIESRPAAQEPGGVTGSTALLVRLQKAKPFRVLYGGLCNTSSGVGFIADVENAIHWVARWLWGSARGLTPTCTKCGCI